MTYQIDPADLEALVAKIAAVEGLDEVTDDGTGETKPAQVGLMEQPTTLPGVFVQVFGYTFDTLDAYKVRGRLILAVPDAPVAEALPALAELLAKVATAVRPAGEVTHELLARDGATVPALAFPFVARCTPATETGEP